jgi:hypothetical protein
MAPTTTTLGTAQKNRRTAAEKIRPDLNLEKWTIWSPAKSKTQPREKTLRRVFDLPDGRRVTAEVEVGFTNKGVLTTEDQRTFYALLKLWEDKGRSTEQTYYSLRRLAKVLKKRWGTNVIHATSESLIRLRVTPLIWKNSYHDSAEKETVEILDPFNILSDLKIIRRKSEGHITKEYGYFKFNDFILKNILAHYTKPLLIETVLSFRSEIAQLLYTHLDLIMYRRTHYERNTRDLLYDDLGLEGESYQNPSNRKQILERALTELRGVRLTSGVITSATIEKTKDGKDYKVIFHKSARQQVSPSDNPQERGEGEFSPAIVEALTSIDGQDAALGADEVGDYATATQSSDTLTTQARDVVLYFYKYFHGTEKAYPPSKAIGQAIALIAHHGEELARYIVDFAHKAAPETNFKIETFGGVLQYTSRAIKAYDAAQANKKSRQQEKDKEREAKLQDRYRRYRNTKIQEIESTLSAPELENLKAAIREKLLAKNPNPTGINLGIQIDLDAELADRAGVLPYKEWREEQITT